jgi:uncharacterized membrane protein YdjX (TVP38/TMEM64 family)
MKRPPWDTSSSFAPRSLRTVPDPATSKIRDSLRDRAGVVGAATRQLAGPRALATVVAITVLIAVAMLVPLPSPVQLRDWVASVGPWFPLAFLAAHIVVTVLPFPRTVFTLAAGLLFGPVLGVAIAVAASTASAVLAVLLVRAAGWQLSRLVAHRAIDTVDERLRERGWVAILSLRLIPAVPFSVINYAAGASAVRLAPYTWATLAGLLPGTAAVVILGDALAGHPTPALFLASLCTGALGLALLVFEMRGHRKRHHASQDTSGHDAPAAESAVSR